MNFLLMSAFAENGRESGANRLRKLRIGLERNGSLCTWLGPLNGFVAYGAIRKLSATAHLLYGAIHWLLCNRNGFVLLSLPPPWLLPIAFVLSLLFPSRLLIDFRDPILNQKINSRSPLYRSVLKFLEATAIQRCRLVIVAASKIKDHVSIGTKNVITVLAGLDESELSDTHASKIKRDCHKIVYGGTFYGTRSPLSLLAAIALEPGKLQYEFYVSFNSEAEEKAAREKISTLGLSHRVSIYSQLPRAEFMKILRSAGAGLVITHSEGSDYAIPGKIFDYISAGVLPWVISSDPGLLEFLGEHKIHASVGSGWAEAELRAGIRKLEKTLESETFSEVHLDQLTARAQAMVLLDALAESV